jgi:hypothetical protein
MLASWLPPDYGVIVNPLLSESYAGRDSQGRFALSDSINLPDKLKNLNVRTPGRNLILVEL